MTSIRYRHLAIPVCLVAALAAAIDARASEAKSEFELQARVTDITPAAKGGAVTARVQVFLEAFRAAREVELTVEAPGATPWLFKGSAVTLDRPEWTGPGGEPLEPDADGIQVPSRGMIVTTVSIPVEKNGPREVVLRATGIADGKPVVATAYVRIVLAGDPGAIVEADGLANFGLGEVK